MTIKEYLSECKKCKREDFISVSEVNVCPACSNPSFSVVVPWASRHEYKKTVTMVQDEQKIGVDIPKITGLTRLRCSHCKTERPSKDIKILKCSHCGNTPKFVRFKKVKS